MRFKCSNCEDTGRVPDDGDELGCVVGLAFEIAGVTKRCPQCNPSTFDRDAWWAEVVRKHERKT